jgi:hypothetical protein
MKYNKNLAGVQITDELINRASSASVRLAHDTILASTVVVRTAPAGGGTLLSLTTDYTLGSEDARLTTEAGGTVNTTLAIVNGARLNTNLYVTYKTVGDYAEAEDINGIIASVTVSGNYTVGNEQTVNVTAATADITIPAGLPIGTRKTIRKLNATTTSSVNILRSGSEIFTSASLTSVPIFGDGSFWVIEKVTSTRWELVGGSDYRVSGTSSFEKRYDGNMTQLGNVPSYTSSSTLLENNIYYVDMGLVSFLTSFSAAPKVTSTVNQSSGRSWLSASATPTTSGFSPTYLGTNPIFNISQGASYIAEGRWY